MLLMIKILRWAFIYTIFTMCFGSMVAFIVIPDKPLWLLFVLGSVGYGGYWWANHPPKCILLKEDEEPPY